MRTEERDTTEKQDEWTKVMKEHTKTRKWDQRLKVEEAEGDAE